MINKKKNNIKKIVNKPEVNLKFNKLENAFGEIKKDEKKIIKEIFNGVKTSAKYPKTVTIFGSARIKKGEKYYEKTKNLSKKISDEGFSVITGGGPGLMEAANQGPYENGKDSIGFNIELPFEQSINPYVTDEVSFKYFFTRKLSMNYSSRAYICVPGGFGTMDEFFQILTLVQTKKVQKVPIILYGKDFWNPLQKYIKDIMLKKFKTISKSDLDLYKITDSDKEVISILKKAKKRTIFYK